MMDGLSLGLFFSFLAVCLAGPVYLPLRNAVPEWVYQTMLLPFTAVFVCGLWWFYQRKPLSAKLAKGLTLSRVYALAGSVLLTLGFALQLISTRKFGALGYPPVGPGLSAIYVAGLAAFLWLGLCREMRPKRWLALSLTLYLAISIYSIAYYPLPLRSDMLTMLQQGSRAFLDGAWDKIYLAPPALAITYLPGLWFTYLPAEALHIDLRWVSVASTLIAAGLLWNAATAAQRALLSGMLLIWLLSPWMLFRHDAYVHGFWVFLALIAWGLAKGRPWAVVLGTACFATQSQIAWAFVPFMLAHLWQSRGPRWGGIVVLSVLGALAVLVLPIYLLQPAQFLQNTFGIHSGQVTAENPNTVWWLALLLPMAALRPVLGLGMVALLARAWHRVASAEGGLRWACLGLLIFITGNSPVRDYFFFIPGLLMMGWVLLEPAKRRKGE